MTDEQARWALRTVVGIARSHTNNCEQDADDVAAEAVLGLVRCSGRFDPTRCARWKTWARTFLQQRAIDAVRIREGTRNRWKKKTVSLEEVKV